MLTHRHIISLPKINLARIRIHVSPMTLTDAQDHGARMVSTHPSAPQAHGGTHEEQVLKLGC